MISGFWRLQAGLTVKQQASPGCAVSIRSLPLKCSDEKTVRSEIDVSAAEVRQLIVKTNEIYQLLSRNLNASTQLFSLVGPPATRIERARTLARLALYGVALLLLAFPVIVILCLLHNRVREEEAAERGVSVPVEEPA